MFGATSTFFSHVFPCPPSWEEESWAGVCWVAEKPYRIDSLQPADLREGKGASRKQTHTHVTRGSFGCPRSERKGGGEKNQEKKRILYLLAR